MLAGATNVTVAWVLTAVALAPVGAPGTVAAVGVTTLVATEAAPVPTMLVAVTVKVYAVPLVKPVITMGDAPPDNEMPPGLEVTV